jgi:hypothetical protein
MKILIACEESQVITTEYRKLRLEAYSCDLQDTSGQYPEYHIKDDAIKVLYRKIWDLVIAHPPCTKLCNSGVRWIKERNLWKELEEATQFFNKFVEYAKKGNRIVIENPIPHKYAKIPKYSQLIQPYQFVETESKATCLWLYRLNKLIPTKIMQERNQNTYLQSPGPERNKLRSKTFKEIAQSMANQWNDLNENNTNKQFEIQFK